MDSFHRRRHGFLDASLERDGVGPGRHITQALADQRLGQDCGRSGAVAGDVVGLGGHLLHELGSHVLEVVLELNLLGDGHPVVGDGGGTPAFGDDDVAPLWA